ncbi:hypothetical protein V8C26DRAFT_73043 [Trichoderma gracile]
MDWARVLRPSERLRAVKSSPWGDSLVNAGGEDKGSKQQRLSILTGDWSRESAIADKMRRQGLASSLVCMAPGHSPTALRMASRADAVVQDLGCKSTGRLVGCFACKFPGCCAALRYVSLSAATATATAGVALPCVALRYIALVWTLRYDIVIIEPNSRDSIHAASNLQSWSLALCAFVSAGDQVLNEQARAIVHLTVDYMYYLELRLPGIPPGQAASRVSADVLHPSTSYHPLTHCTL